MVNLFHPWEILRLMGSPRLAEMNPDWDPLTEEDLPCPEDTSDSAELVLDHDSDSDETGGFPNIQRVVAVPARLTEYGGLQRMGPAEVISEADPAWNQLDQDHCMVCTSL